MAASLFPIYIFSYMYSPFVSWLFSGHLFLRKRLVPWFRFRLFLRLPQFLHSNLFAHGNLGDVLNRLTSFPVFISLHTNMADWDVPFNVSRPLGTFRILFSFSCLGRIINISTRTQEAVPILSTWRRILLENSNVCLALQLTVTWRGKRHNFRFSLILLGLGAKTIIPSMLSKQWSNIGWDWMWMDIIW